MKVVDVLDLLTPIELISIGSAQGKSISFKN
jgi:hypothetical protein